MLRSFITKMKVAMGNPLHKIEVIMEDQPLKVTKVSRSAHLRRESQAAFLKIELIQTPAVRTAPLKLESYLTID